MKLAISTIIFILLGGVFALPILLNRQVIESSSTQILSPLPQITVNDSPTIKPTPKSQNLKNIIDHALINAKSTYGIVVKDLTTGESYAVGQHQIFEPASLYKLWVMSTVFDQIQKNTLSLDEILSQDIAILNNEFNIDPQLAEQTEGTITLSVAEAVNNMITVSDNYSALLLAEKVKNSSIQKFLQDHGFTESTLGDPPSTTAADIALFLEKLSKGELANKENTEAMINILKKQTQKTKIPKYLPQNLVIAHKTGEINSFTHDAGIVYLDHDAYIIVALSEGDDTIGAEERIANLSLAVFNYFYNIAPK
jgi:beta-lactamase class A